MKKMRRLLVVLLAAVLLASAVPTGAIAAEEYYTEGYYTYCVENGEAAVISVDTAVSGAVTVPDTLGGCPVTLIGSNAFSGCSAVTEVILPDSVTEIGDSAFHLCYYLRRVVMGSNVSVLGNGAFSECRELSEIALSEENPYFTVVDGVLFNEDMTALIRYPSVLREDKYVIPESVTRIEANAFQGCYYLFEIVIPDSVTEIGDFAFDGCTKIRDIVLPPYITEISDYAFSNCYNLENVSIPEGVSEIGAYAFAYNEKLTLVSIPSGTELISDYAFYNSNAVSDVYYGGTEEQWAELYIGEYNDSLLSSELHYGLCEHKMSKFILEAIPSSSACAAVSRCAECGYHISRYVPDTSIEDAGAYYDGTYIFRAENGEATIIAAVAEFSGDVVIPRELDGNTVTSIEGFVFYGRNNIRSITLPETLESFDAVAFSGLDAECILIPASVREIRLRDTDNISINGFRVHEDNPYYSSDEYNVLFNKDKTELIMGNMNLIDYTVPESVKRIGVASFCGTARLERIVLPEGLESIGQNAFLLSHSLREIVIPDSVTSVGESAFDQCQFLEKITVLSRDAEIGENIYYYIAGPMPFPLDKELYEELYYHYGRMMDAFYRGHEEEYMLHMEKADAILSGEYEVGEYMTVIYCYEGSTADIYAQERELPVVYLCDHDKTVLPAVPPTCTETGLTEGLACSKCGEVYTAQETVPATGVHDMTEWVNDFAAGTSSRECNNCHYSQQKNLGYNYNGIYATEADGFIYTIQNGEAIILGYIGTATDLVIPSVFEGCPVTTIYEWAFAAADNAPGGDYFSNSWNFESIVIPDTVTDIGPSAFRNCINLKSVKLSEFAVVIGEGAFDGCSSLKSISIPDSVKAIGSSAFWQCRKLERVELSASSSLVSIGGSAFAYCSSLADITLPASLEIIESSAFSMTAIEELYIPASVKRIEMSLFEGGKCKKFIVDESNPYYSTDEIGVLFNKDKTELVGAPVNFPAAVYSIPSGVIKIGRMAFYGTLNIKEIIMPDSVKEIEENGILEVPYLEKISISENLETIGDSGISACPKLDNVVLPETLKYVGVYNLAESLSLRKLTILSKDAQFNDMSFGYIHYGYTDDENRREIADSMALLLTLDFTVPENEELKKEVEEKLHSLLFVRDEGEYTKDTCTVYCYEGSTAHTFAVENGISYVLICEHEEAILPAVPPTCTETGLTEGLACSKCGEVYTTQETVPVIDHSHTPSVTTPATHLSEGVMTYTCVCGDSFTETIARLEEHTYTAAVTAPTCTEKGFTTYTCACGDSYTADYTEPSGHAMGEWTVNGSVRTRSCAVCGMKETVAETDDGNVEIEAPDNPGHDFEVDEVIKGGDKFILVEEAVKGASGVDAEVLKAFDINLKNHDGVHVQPDGTVKVKLPLDWEKNGNYKVYRVNDDGSLTDMNAFRQGSHMVFETDHFSIYVIVEETPAEEEPSTEEEKPQSGKKDVFLFLTRLVRALEKFFVTILEILGF